MTKRALAALASLVLLALLVTGCTQASRTSYNLSKEADNFNIARRLVVINTITDTPILELSGVFSIKSDNADNQLEVTVAEEDGTYSKHFVSLPPTVMYTVEQLDGAKVSTTRYQISYLPEAIIPIEAKRGN